MWMQRSHFSAVFGGRQGQNIAACCHQPITAVLALSCLARPLQWTVNQCYLYQLYQCIVSVLLVFGGPFASHPVVELFSATLPAPPGVLRSGGGGFELERPARRCPSLRSVPLLQAGKEGDRKRLAGELLWFCPVRRFCRPKNPEVHSKNAIMEVCIFDACCQLNVAPVDPLILSS